MGRNVVERLRRSEEYLYRLEDRASPYITYVGRTDLIGAPTDQPVWQIQRITVVGDDREVMYANYGKFNNIWDLKHTYFPTPPPPSPPTNHGLPEEVDIYPGQHRFFDFVGLATPGTEQLLISHTVAVDEVMYLHRLTLDCWQHTQMRVKIAGVQIAAGHNGYQGFGEYVWTPYRHVSQGLLVEVFAKVNPTTLPADLSVHLMTSVSSA